MIYCLAGALGIFSVSFFPYLPNTWVFSFLLFTLCILLWRRYWLLFTCVLGVVYGAGFGVYLLDNQLPLKLDGEHFLVTGRVMGLPETSEKGQRFQLQVDTLTLVENPDNHLTQMQGKKINLSWYHYSRSKPNSPLVKSGDYWHLQVKLRRPRGLVNPAGFDYQRYLLQKNIMATGYVRTSSENQFEGNHCRFYQTDCWRAHLREKFSHSTLLFFDQAVVQVEMLGPLLGLMLGNRQLINQEQWRLLRNTGTIHLMAISGLHIGLAALMGYAFGQFIRRVIQLLLPYYNLFALPALSSIIFSLFYSVLAGFSLPTLRAFIMVTVFHIYIMLRSYVSPWVMLSVALLVIALLDPLAVYSQGFWLSFLAVSVLLLGFSGYRPGTPWEQRSVLVEAIVKCINRSLKAQVVITLGLLLPSIILMQGVSLSSPLANLFAIPWVSFCTVPLLFISLLTFPLSLFISHYCFALAGMSLHWLFQYLEWIDSIALPFWNFDRGPISFLAVVLAFIGILWMLLPKGVPRRWLGCILCLPIFFPQVENYPLRVTFLDAGQGTAVVVETKNHQMVYDTGREFSERFNIGEHVLAPYLMSQGHSSNDLLVVSHADSDHAGGMNGLLRYINFSKIISGEPGEVNAKPCIAGDSWRWDGVEFSVLWPESNHLLKGNNASCVIMMKYGGNSILLPGDIEKKVERQLLATYDLSDVTIVMAPHHGSRSSSHLQWVEYLNPQIVVFTAGHNNAYNHPHPQVISRYEKQGTRSLNTAHQGAIRFTFTKNGGFEHEVWRKNYRNYWHEQE